jgi:uncharacterized lipoprotein YmbA
MSKITEIILIMGIIACLILDLMIWYQLDTIPYKPTEKEVIKEELVTKEVEVPNPCKDFSIHIEEVKQSLVDLQVSTDNLNATLKEVQTKVNYFEKKPTIIVDTDGNITQTINQKK